MKFVHPKIPFLSLIALSLVFTACNDDDDADDNTPAGPTQNIVEIAAGNSDFSILADAVTQAGLVQTLETGTRTVFAPDNAAFNAFFDENNIDDANEDGSRVDDLIGALGEDAVRETLLYHVLGAEIRAADVPEKAYITTASTLSPGENQLSLLVESRSTGVILNNQADVTNADILATNGVIHRINQVLTLPNVADHAINNPADLSELVAAVLQADLATTLSDATATYTVFAPTNAAFTNDPADLTTDELTTVLTYHVLDDQVRSDQVSNGTVATLGGQEIMISVTSEGVFITDTDDNVASVFFTDIQGTNGVVHLIDGVLMPQL